MREEQRECPIKIPAGQVMLEGDLCLTPGSSGIVVFAHGSGSSRLSPRNRYVAGTLRKAGLSTLLFDLLTRPEEASDAIDAHLRFNIELLAGRLIQATDWLARNDSAKHLKIGYFGASTGAAAALVAAAARPSLVKAVVSRGGRPDLAGDALERVQAPTLLIVGGDDLIVLDLNVEAKARMNAVTELAIIPGATHLFEEPGALEQVSALAVTWFKRYLK